MWGWDMAHHGGKWEETGDGGTPQMAEEDSACLLEGQDYKYGGQRENWSEGVRLHHQKEKA